MDIKEFLKEFYSRSGYDFCDYSANSISRRLQKVCDEMKMSFEQILDCVAADKELVRAIVEDITVNTTELFRDPQVWIALSKILPRQLPKQSMSTLWHVGCSTGLEVYSDIILLNELGLIDRARVIGTDINPSVLERACKGVYPFSFNRQYLDSFAAVMAAIGSEADFDKYFEIDTAADTMTVRPEFRSKAKFLKQDLVKDKPPFAYRVDVVFLRNVMIYFNESLQTRVMREVLAKMHDGALLILGKQEDLPSAVKAQFVPQGMFYKKAR